MIIINPKLVINGISIAYTPAITNNGELAPLGFIVMEQSLSQVNIELVDNRVRNSIPCYVDKRRKPTLLTLLGQNIVLEGRIEFKTNNDCVATHAVLKIRSIIF